MLRLVKLFALIWAVNAGEKSAKTTFQSSSRGAIKILVSSDSKWIALENTSRKDELLWTPTVGPTIARVIDGKTTTYTLQPLLVKARTTIKLWPAGFTKRNPNDVIVDIQSWGVGANIVTTLYNQYGEARAWHEQKTVYTS